MADLADQVRRTGSSTSRASIWIGELHTRLLQLALHTGLVTSLRASLNKNNAGNSDAAALAPAGHWRALLAYRCKLLSADVHSQQGDLCWVIGANMR